MNNDTFTPSPIKNPSNSKIKRIIIIVVITIVALGAIATAVVFALPLLKSSPSNTLDSVPKTGIRANVDETKNFDKDKTAMFGHFEVKINKVTHDYKSNDSLAPQNPGYKFLVLNITAKNTDKDAHLLSDIDLAVLSGQDIINSTYVISVDPVLKAGSVEAGSSITGNLVYEVPPEAKDLALYYNTQIYSNEKEKIRKIEYTLAF